MESMSALLSPRAIAVVGASQRRGRGTNVIANLRDNGFPGDIFAVNPRYDEVLGYRCFPSVSALPASVDCLVVAVAADAACDVLEEAHAHGIRSAIVLSAGFGEGGHGEDRARRLRALAARGLCICGPNCFGVISIKARMAAFSGAVTRPLRPGPVALVSQSGGLGASVFAPLMTDRELGFSYFVSCGNQLGATVEDYVEYFVEDPDVTVVAAVVEALTNPRKLARVARTAHARGKTLIFFHAGRSAAGQLLTRSHTGALVGNAELLAAFLRRCGIVQTHTHDALVEAIELFTIAPHDDAMGREVVVVSGSGGGAAVAADVLEDAGIALATLDAATQDRIRAVLPEFGSVTNPIDATGAIYDDATLLPKILDAIASDPGRPIIAVSVNARPVGNKQTQGLAHTIAAAARASGRSLVAYQYSPLGGPLDPEIVTTLHGARVPFLLGISNAMQALRHLPLHRDYRRRAGLEASCSAGAADGLPVDFAACDFAGTRRALVASGVPVVETAAARSADEAVAAWRRFATAVAVKADAPGLLHKSDLGCVRLGCAGEADVRDAYRSVIAHARKAGFADADRVLVQPMVAGVAEVYAGILDDPVLGPAVCFGLGGIFVEIMRDTATEMAPLSHADAVAMIGRIKAAPILAGARGRPRADIDALAALLVGLGNFAVAHAGRLRALDLNPVIVKAAGEGVVAVDIAIEPAAASTTDAAAPA